jgi:type VI secretion system protein ImpE
MNAQQLYQAGRLDEAMEALAAALRVEPGDVRSRTFLFELLCFAGQYDRAAKQLDIISDSSPEAGMGALLYRSALHAERSRQEMFANALIPETAPVQVSGTLNGSRFTSLTDADPRIGPRLEVFAAGQYTWLPFAHLAELSVEQPKRLRDLLWAPARVKAGPKFQDFEFGEVIIPAVAPLSWKNAAWPVRLGHEVDWVELPDGREAPVGPKMLLVDEELVPILGIRELMIDAAGDA